MTRLFMSKCQVPYFKSLSHLRCPNRHANQENSLTSRTEHAHNVAMKCLDLANNLETKLRVQRNTLRCRQYTCTAAPASIRLVANHPQHHGPDSLPLEIRMHSHKSQATYIIQPLQHSLPLHPEFLRKGKPVVNLGCLRQFSLSLLAGCNTGGIVGLFLRWLLVVLRRIVAARACNDLTPQKPTGRR